VFDDVCFAGSATASYNFLTVVISYITWFTWH